MSVSSISSAQYSPPPAQYTDQSSTSTSTSQQAYLQQLQRPEYQPNNKDGDEIAAAQQTAKAPLPPGQGTRVDILV